MVELTPPDLEQCQCEKPNGCTAFTLGGKPGLIRCDNEPFVILVEKEVGADGLKGSMSLCQECLTVFNLKMPDKAVEVQPIIRDQP